MIKSLIVADDFAPNPEEIRDKALKAGFRAVEYLGDTYEHIGLDYDPGLEELIEELIETRIDPKMKFFRCDLESDKRKAWVHMDAVCANWATVLYLNPPEDCRGGTAFWKHKETGWDRLPVLEQVQAIGLTPNEAGAILERDWTNPDKWDMRGFVGMKFNRFITYPTTLFHSRYPFEAFGDSEPDGRLIHVTFYDLKTE